MSEAVKLCGFARRNGPSGLQVASTRLGADGGSQADGLRKDEHGGKARKLLGMSGFSQKSALC